MLPFFFLFIIYKRKKNINVQSQLVSQLFLCPSSQKKIATCLRFFFWFVISSGSILFRILLYVCSLVSRSMYNDKVLVKMCEEKEVLQLKTRITRYKFMPELFQMMREGKFAATFIVKTGGEGRGGGVITFIFQTIGFCFVSMPHARNLYPSQPVCVQ